MRWLVAAVAAWSWVASCAGEDPAGDAGPEALQAFLEGAAPVPEEPSELRELGEVFADQAVRAGGYRRAGVDDAEMDGWSPVVRARGSAAEPADVSRWVDAGDIDASGRFAPRGDLCDGEGPFPTEGLPEEALEIAGVQDRIAALSCALSRLAGGEVEIAWTGPSSVGLTLEDEGGPVLVNARVLHLIPQAAAPEGAVTPVGAAGPARGGTARAAPTERNAGPAPEAQNVEVPGAEHHPRPKPDSDSSSSDKSACDSACDDVFNDAFRCDSGKGGSGGGSSSSSSSGCGSGSGGSSSSGCGKSSGGGGSSCGKCSSGGGSGDANAMGLSLSFLAALMLRRRRSRRLGGLIAFVAVLFMSYPAYAQDPEWKRHQQTGAEHLQAKRYAEAITELRAAHALRPAPENLEKIALAQKALNRHTAAIATLEALLEQFGKTMTPARQKQVKDDIERLRAALVPVRVQVQPAQARVSVDGEPLPDGAAAAPVLVAPGKHSFSAALDGYAPAVKEMDVPAGAKDVVVALGLVPDKVHVVVRAPSPELQIAVDGVPVGTGTWAGLLPPGRHVVQIHPAGQPGSSYYVDGAAGQTVEVPSAATPPAPNVPPPPSSAPPPKEPEPPPAPPKPSVRGPYGIGIATLLWQTSRPYGFEHSGAPAPGFALGGRIGYRISSVVGFELLGEYGRISNGGDVIQAFDTDQNGDGDVTGSESFTDVSDATYILQSIRVGPTLRLMSRGEENRFVGGIGIGGLHEIIDLEHEDILWNDASQRYESEGRYAHDYSGWSPYLLLEGGYERSVGNLLLGGSLQATIEVVSDIKDEPYNSSVQARVGLSLRVGYASWSRVGAPAAQAARRPPPPPRL